MIIEVPILVLVCLWSWKHVYRKGILTQEESSSYSWMTMLSNIINLIWLILWYPNLVIDAGVVYYIFAVLYICVSFVIFRECRSALKLYLILSSISFLAIRAVLLIENRIQYLIYIFFLETGTPLFWILILQYNRFHRRP